MYTNPKGLMPPEKNSKKLHSLLHKTSFHRITPYDFASDSYYIFDLTASNNQLGQIDLNDEVAFCGYIFDTLKQNNCLVGIGGYNEHRALYSRSEMFSGDENRSLHLGIDIWSNAGTPIFAPLEGIVHSFQNNNHHGDYGPTIILEHRLEEHTFYTLYGHLSKGSLRAISKGEHIKEGQKFASFGEYHENVHWPPHLHFQLIIDIQDYWGDFPGVCKFSEREKWLANCPDPNLIIKCDGI